MSLSLILSDPAQLAHSLTEVQKTNTLISGGRTVDTELRADSSLQDLYFCLVTLLVTPRTDRIFLGIAPKVTGFPQGMLPPTGLMV